MIPGAIADVPFAVGEVLERIGRDLLTHRAAAGKLVTGAVIEADGISALESSSRRIVHDRPDRLTNLQRGEAAPGSRHIAAAQSARGTE